jgi:protein TonB
MLQPKLDICKTEWLDLVFAKRNKEYGAYCLRKEYAHNINNVMAVTFLSVISLLMMASEIMKYNAPAVALHETVIEINDYTPTATTQKSVKSHSTAKQVSTQLPFAPVLTNNPIISDMPVTVANMPAATEEIVVPGNDIDLSGASGAGNTQTDESNTIYSTTASIEAKPQPVGGDAAWRVFMQQNLHYPPEAASKNAHGKVTLSFVVEKDGQLSNIVVEQAAGYCMDEEAYRVLKLAKAWKPGLKDGQPVRVKCPIVLSFIVGR